MLGGWVAGLLSLGSGAAMCGMVYRRVIIEREAAQPPPTAAHKLRYLGRAALRQAGQLNCLGWAGCKSLPAILLFPRRGALLLLSVTAAGPHVGLAARCGSVGDISYSRRRDLSWRGY